MNLSPSEVPDSQAPQSSPRARPHVWSAHPTSLRRCRHGCRRSAERRLVSTRRRVGARANPARTGLGLGSAASAARVQGCLHEPLHRHRCRAPPCRHRRSRVAVAPHSWLAPDVVRVAARDAGARPAPPGGRRRPTGHRPVRETGRRLRHRHPRRRHGGRDGGPRPRPIRGLRDRCRDADRVRGGRRSPRSGRSTRRFRGVLARHQGRRRRISAAPAPSRLERHDSGTSSSTSFPPRSTKRS